MARHLRVVEDHAGRESGPTLTGAEVLCKVFEVVDRYLPFVPDDDPVMSELREIHAGLRSVVWRRAHEQQGRRDG